MHRSTTSLGEPIRRHAATLESFIEATKYHTFFNVNACFALVWASPLAAKWKDSRDYRKRNLSHLFVIALLPSIRALSFPFVPHFIIAVFISALALSRTIIVIVSTHYYVTQNDMTSTCCAIFSRCSLISRCSVSSCSWSCCSTSLYHVMEMYGVCWNNVKRSRGRHETDREREWHEQTQNKNYIISFLHCGKKRWIMKRSLFGLFTNSSF